MEKADQTKSEIAASAADSALRTAGRYEILGEIGRGGMGIVYRARQPELDRMVALKRLHSVHTATPDLVQRFIRESRLTGSLNHPNIVTVHDYFEEGDTSYIAMEYIRRGSLRSWVGKMSLAQLAGVLEGLLAGLAAVEPSATVHRDLKPENVMVTDDGRVKITDFGIAKATQSTTMASFMTATNATVGTPAYMAPEQALSNDVGPWTDLYSVGVMTYEQLVGHVPFYNSPTPMALMLRHINEPISPVINSRPDIDPALSEWINRLLVKEPTERTRSAARAWEELEEIVLEQLGPRWRRNARLSEPDSAASGSRPLTPAPFQSHRISTPDEPSAPSNRGSKESFVPQAESGFISYGRAPTGAEEAREGLARSVAIPPASSTPENPTGEPRQSEAPSSSSVEALAARTRSTRRLRARRLGLATILAVLAGAVGFALAPDKGTKALASHNVPASSLHGLPNRAYALTLSQTFSRLNGIRAHAGAQLSRAHTPHSQAIAAQDLSNAHAQAAERVGKAAPGPAERATNSAIATALADIGSGYSKMARAARHENRQDFNNGRKLVIATTSSLATALSKLQALGYKVAN